MLIFPTALADSSDGSLHMRWNRHATNAGLGVVVALLKTPPNCYMISYTTI